MNMQQLIEQALKQHGFDGLFNTDGGCACKVDDLFPCDNPCADCEPGYLAPCDGSCEDPTRCDWHMERHKLEKKGDENGKQEA